MTHLILLKTQTGWANGNRDAEEVHHKTKPGAAIHSDFKKMRNVKFHRKFFALLNLGFEYWEPGEINSKYGVPVKNFDRFRKDATILAGFHHLVIRLDGSSRVEADSISFGKMDEVTFADLYQKVLTVLMDRIPMLKKMGEEEIDRLTNQFLEFV